MEPGSVIIDLAGDSGGNCELTEAGKTVVSDNGVKVISPVNLPSDMAAHASQLYAKNLENFIGLITSEEGALDLDFGDEVVAGACLTHGGEIKNERAKSVVEGG
jgi:NAD(P) transhydrogenase subunit alpha